MESEGREGADVRTSAPTVRKPSQNPHNKSMATSLRTLVLINDIKENVHKTSVRSLAAERMVVDCCVL